ncbi:hypothetical protein A0H81_14073 [Grifola frondosa]|uniref:Rho-GAP domain-containing protein n=1 Tax=Grifola frondosa TaxID=5627 RepID=A0A1C7LMS3_GRIFR|nr:hypothetical protein A0H81_14073 [Grifola frondosa]
MSISSRHSSHTPSSSDPSELYSRRRRSSTERHRRQDLNPVPQSSVSSVRHARLRSRSPPRGILRQPPPIRPTFLASASPTPSVPATYSPRRETRLDASLASPTGDTGRPRERYSAFHGPPPPVVSRPRHQSQPARAPDFTPQDPREVLKSLRRVLRGEGKRLEDRVDVEEIMEALRKQSSGEEQQQKQRKCHAFGVPVDESVRCSSVRTTLGGYQHDLPLVVYACVEELSRTGIYQSGLFRDLPNRPHLFDLVHAFDRACSTPPVLSESTSSPLSLSSSSSTSSSQRSLHKETMPNICALLTTYLAALPEPLVDRHLYSALLHWCVKPTLVREEERRAEEVAQEMEGNTSPQSSFGGWPARASTDRHRAAPAPPPPARELLAPGLPARILHGAPALPDNGITFEDVARMFGRGLLGGAGAEKVEQVMVWLLSRWGSILDGLFDGTEGGESSVEREARERTVERADKNAERSQERRRASLPAKAIPIRPEPQIWNPSFSESEATPKQRDTLSWTQLEDGFPTSSTRPYSLSVSSDESSLTFASSSDTGDSPELEAFQLPPYEKMEVAVSLPENDERDLLPSDRLFRMSYVDFGSDTGSLYSTDVDERCASRNGAGSASPASDERAVASGELSPQTESEPHALPSDLDTSNRELALARQRILELEHELRAIRSSRALSRAPGESPISMDASPNSHPRVVESVDPLDRGSLPQKHAGWVEPNVDLLKKKLVAAVIDGALDG